MALPNFRGHRVTSVEATTGTILIYRLGSLGDTVVALPSLRLIARTFPQAERWILTNRPVANKAAPLAQVIEGAGLVHGFLDYPLKTRSLAQITELRASIRKLAPTVLIYLIPYRGLPQLIRDYLFFRACGIRKIVGMPFDQDLRQPIYDPASDSWEPEATRLTRCIHSIGNAQIDEASAWDLGLTDAEQAESRRILTAWNGVSSYIVACLGTKADTKDWGGENWSKLLKRVSEKNPELGLLLVGAPDEYALSEQAARMWKGPLLNLCGRTSPRLSAALISKARAYVGHDSGPMHLAAAVGVPSIAVFSARNRPGEWFPRGANNRVIYHKTECFGCGLEVCPVHLKKCIAGITVDEVLWAVEETLGNLLAPG